MDRYIKSFPCLEDGDLNICNAHGMAYQRDMSNLIRYDSNYWKNYLALEGTQIANKLNEGRIAFVERFYKGELLDIGIGSGEFIKSRPETFGYDINELAVKWLLESNRYREDFGNFYAFTMWDVLEHIPVPENYFINFPPGAFLFISIPIFGNLSKIRESKHYKPGEHLYYFSQNGLISWMKDHGFGYFGKDDFETLAGRESIYSFAFRKL